MVLLDLIQDVRDAAEAEERGDPESHAQLLRKIQKLNLKAEYPVDTAMRMRFQVIKGCCLVDL